MEHHTFTQVRKSNENSIKIKAFYILLKIQLKQMRPEFDVTQPLKWGEIKWCNIPIKVSVYL